MKNILKPESYEPVKGEDTKKIYPKGISSKKVSDYLFKEMKEIVDEELKGKIKED